MKHVAVVGGANLDVKARSTAPLVAGTSNPGRTCLAPAAWAATWPRTWPGSGPRCGWCPRSATTRSASSS